MSWYPDAVRKQAKRLSARTGLHALYIACSSLCACAPAARTVQPAAAYAESEAEPAAPAGPKAVAPTEYGCAVEAPRCDDEADGELAHAAADAEVPTPARYVNPPLPLLAPFYDQVAALLAGERKQPVRILWLGDSHTAADFMTDQIRSSIDQHWKPGGPGFLRVGLDGARHGQVRIKNTGRWRKAPILPAQRTRVLDGIFGYGGIRTLPAAGAASTLRYARPKGVTEDAPLQWVLSYRLPAGAALEVRLGEHTTVLKASREQHQEILQTSFTAPAGTSFEIRHYAGDPEVFGVDVELVEPGVVFDTVGINGARAATVLAWEPTAFQQQVKRRNPQLLALAFGTNEVFDKTNPDRFEDHTIAVVELVREVLPDIPCWIVGPPDAATDGGKSRTRVAEVTAAQQRAAEKLGCAFTSAAELMGGEGSFGEWMRARPALARTDHIHLTIAGYKQLGDNLASALLGRAASEQ